MVNNAGYGIGGSIEEPPLYLLLGSDAFSRAFAKLDLLAASYKQWEALTKSTDY